jgi:hypothetical protein
MKGREEICRTVMDVLRYEGLNDGQVSRLLEFCRQQIGKPFPKSIRGESLTYIFGLPNVMFRPDRFACHSLIFAAFSHIGIDFPHHLEAAPFFNIARYLGHPLGHNGGKVNPRYTYLRDHHLYEDSRFRSILSLTWEQSTDEIVISNSSAKFSWNRHLANTYLSTPKAS